MNKFFYPTDERMVAISGKIAIVFLVFTQMALLGSILYRRYGLDQSEADYVDLRIILLISVFGYIATRLYYGAVLPKLSIRKLVKIVKNKVAPPFKRVEADLIYGKGISKIGEIIDIAVEEELIKKAGSWFSYKGDKIGQGRENVKKYLNENPELLKEIEGLVREKLGV